MNTLDPLFDWLLATTLRASVLALVILGIQAMLRRWLPAHWRHALWLPVLLVLVLPVLPAVPFGLFPRSADATMIAVEPSLASEANAALDENTVATPAVPQQSGARVNLFAIGWLAGACAVLGAGVMGYRVNLERIRKQAVTPEEALLRSVTEATREAGLGRVPKVIVSPGVESPAVTGFLRPLLLLPAGFPAGFNRAEERLILLHELTHLKRKDLLVNWVICVLQAMHWFNPILWFAFARMRADREAACDAQVLSLDQADHRSDYGNALLKLQSSAPARMLSLGFVGIFERGSELRSRIREISSHRKAHPAWRVGGVALIGALTLMGATQAQERQPKRQANGAQQNGKAKDPLQVALEKKLDSIVIPALILQDSSLEEAVDFLRMRSKELDAATENAALKGVNLVIRKSGTAQPKTVTLALENVTLRKAIENVAEAGGLTMTVSSFTVTLTPREDAEQLEKLAQSKAMKAASEIIIPVVDIEDASLKEAVDFLNLQAAELAKDGKAPKIELGKLEKGEARVRALKLRMVPLSQALMYVAEQAKVPLFADDEMIRIGK